MTLQTRTHDCLTGTKVICEGGEIKRVSETGLPVGTEVEVEQLFYNIPVKRKFLKSIRSELRFALSHFLRLSLSHPTISFRFIHDGRTLHEHVKTESPLVESRPFWEKRFTAIFNPSGSSGERSDSQGLRASRRFRKGMQKASIFTSTSALSRTG